MTIDFEQKIKEIALQLERGFSYVYASKNEANQLLDNIELPAVVNLLPVSGKCTLKGNSTKIAPNCLIGFFDKSNTEEKTAEEVTTVNSNMLYDAMEFVVKLNKSGMFETVTEFDWENVEEYDAVVSGVVIQLQLKERAGVLICEVQ